MWQETAGGLQNQSNPWLTENRCLSPTNAHNFTKKPVCSKENPELERNETKTAL